MSHAKQIYYHNLRENLRNMNPKLKSLAVEAGAYIDGDNLLTSAMDVAKFAELIISECCVALHPMLRDMISRTQGVDLIVKHFRGDE